MQLQRPVNHPLILLWRTGAAPAAVDRQMTLQGSEGIAQFYNGREEAPHSHLSIGQ
jgi:hypothetical protein